MQEDSSTSSSTSELPHVNTDTAFISNYLDYDGVASEKMQAKMNDIYKHLRGDKNEYSEIDGLNDLRHLMFKLGTPPIGTSKLDHLFGYVKIQNRIDDLERERNNYIR